MIPKKIHYCWGGGNELPAKFKAYIDTWREHCPGYEITEWNESNFDVAQNRYCQETASANKWGFASDYVRLKVLYEYGGIYMDTDVEMLKPLDDLLKYDLFMGFESESSIQSGIIGCKEKHEIIKKLLDEYDEKRFIKADGSLDMTPLPVLISNFLKQNYGVKLNNSLQIFGNNNLLLPFDYLCCKSFVTGKISVTSHSYTIHHFEGSWLDFYGKTRMVIRRIVGEENWRKLKKLMNKS